MPDVARIASSQNTSSSAILYDYWLKIIASAIL